MRQSQSFGQTLREAPGDAEVASHKLLLRGGYIRQIGAGLFTFMPLAYRSIKKIENIIREEIDAIGGQEILMPVVHPADYWKQTGRWYKIGGELGRLHRHWRAGYGAGDDPRGGSGRPYQPGDQVVP